MRKRCVLFVAVCLIAAACSTPSGLRTHSGSTAMSYLERDHGAWLTPQEREHVMCSAGRLLSCGQGAGRLSQTWCECESLVEPGRQNVGF